MALAFNSESYSNRFIENMVALLYSNSSQLMSRRRVHRKGQAVGGSALALTSGPSRNVSSALYSLCPTASGHLIIRPASRWPPCHPLHDFSAAESVACWHVLSVSILASPEWIRLPSLIFPCQATAVTDARQLVNEWVTFGVF